MELFQYPLTETILLLFVFITFFQSGLDKISDWNGNLSWLKSHFAKSPLKNMVPLLLAIVLLMEIATAVCSVWGMYDLLANNERTVALCAASLSCVTLLMLLFGQRMAKDYDGARTIVIYLVPAVLLL
ncbi:MAG: DoxX family protein, partial [Flavobacteriia bacterium]|nr:DoxX family protein [Flavobacteriia bacterium]